MITVIEDVDLEGPGTRVPVATVELGRLAPRVMVYRQIDPVLDHWRVEPVDLVVGPDGHISVSGAVGTVRVIIAVPEAAGERA